MIFPVRSIFFNGQFEKTLTFQAPSPLFNGEPRQAPECLLHLLWRTGAGERDRRTPKQGWIYEAEKWWFNQKRGKPLMI
jgi:hypothetical protein